MWHFCDFSPLCVFKCVPDLTWNFGEIWDNTWSHDKILCVSQDDDTTVLKAGSAMSTYCGNCVTFGEVCDSTWSDDKILCVPHDDDTIVRPPLSNEHKVWYLCDFSPLCVFKCLFRSPA